MLETCLDQAETYLCELKEAQIRTGLHRSAQCRPDAALELLMALARALGDGRVDPGDGPADRADSPWCDEDGVELSASDRWTGSTGRLWLSTGRGWHRLA